MINIKVFGRERQGQQQRQWQQHPDYSNNSNFSSKKVELKRTEDNTDIFNFPIFQIS